MTAGSLVTGGWYCSAAVVTGGGLVGCGGVLAVPAVGPGAREELPEHPAASATAATSEPPRNWRRSGLTNRSTQASSPVAGSQARTLRPAHIVYAAD